MSMSDADLLRRYVEEASGDAFGALVTRHLDLVYSVGRRHAGSSAVAQDIAQSVFIELARNARRIRPGTPLVAWLHVVSRRVALNSARASARRLAREQEAAAEFATCSEESDSEMKPNESRWAGVEPLLDEAVESLPSLDRTAILLRYFENKSLRDIGAALGTSDDAAQKRVSRAIEKLRSFFARRGIAMTAAGLTTDLSAFVLHSAPAGLGSAIVTAAAAVLPATTTAVAQFTMTAFQKLLVATSVTIAISGGIYQVVALEKQSDALQALEGKSNELRQTLARLRSENRTAPNISGLIPTTAGRMSDAGLEAEMKAWMERAVQLKLLMVERPDLTIPEMQLLSDSVLFYMAKNAKFDSEIEVGDLMARLRNLAHSDFARALIPALRSWLGAHPGTLPTDIGQLAFHFPTPIDPAILARYQMSVAINSGQGANPDTSTLLFQEKASDTLHGTRLHVRVNGWSFHPFDPYGQGIHDARENFRRANSDRMPPDAAALLPYFTPPLTPDRQERLIQNGSAYSVPQR